ncbi:MAG: tetratricopeptide repeat protein, partial [Bacillota bacterium]
NRNLNIISRELAQNPDNRLLRYHYGVELFRAERYREAADEFVKAASGIDPQTIYLPKLLRYIALTYQALNLPEKVLEAVRLGLSLFPDYADLHYYGGLASLDLRDYAGAYKFFHEALSMPDQPAHYAPFSGTRGFRSLYNLGRLTEIFCNEEEAINYYIKCLRDNSFFIPALESIARLLEPRKDPEYAKKCLEQVCDFCTPEANLMMGQMLFNQSAYQLALEYLEKGAPETGASPEILIWRAICLIQQRRYLEALRILGGFTPGHQLYPLATLNKAFCFWIRGNRRKVRELADDLFALGLSAETGAVVSLLKNSGIKRKGPGYSLGEEGMSLLLDLVMRTLDLGEVEKAVELLNGLTRASLIENGKTFGNLFFQYGCPELAEGYLRMHLESSPGCAGTHFTLGQIKEELGQYPEAISLYRQALELDSREPRHYIRLTRLYEKMRRELLEEALARHPDSPVLKDLLEGGPAR